MVGWHKNTFKLHQKSILSEFSDKTVSATWSKVGHDLAVVMDNSLYHLTPPDWSKMKLISSGDVNVSVATPNILYSERIWRDSTCMWWAPESRSQLAFVSFKKFKESPSGSEIPEAVVKVANDVNNVQLDFGLDLRYNWVLNIPDF